MSLVEHVPGAASRYPAGWMVGQLPVGMRDDDRLTRFATIFERLAATLREGADGVEHIADPTVTSSAMLIYLGNWLGYDVIDPTLPLERQRRIVRALGQALPWRGTERGLRHVLGAITDGPVRITDPGAVVEADASVTDADVVLVELEHMGHLRAHELVALVRDQVPAHIGVEITVGGVDIRQTAEGQP